MAKLADVSVGAMAAVFGCLALTTVAAAQNDVFIAGVKPQQRPESAPVISKVSDDAAWKKSALHGVSKPYPDTLKFLNNQGNWFTPFAHPGMTGPYDIRGWHKGEGRTVGKTSK